MRRIGVLTLLLLLTITAGALVYLFSSDWPMFGQPNRIAVIEVRGLIDNVQDTLEDLVKLRKDPRIKAFVVRIDSPGGAVGPTQELFRELHRSAESKPVVASLGSVAASGGYYIAAAASRIVSSPGTVTGSIGVIVYYPNLRGLFEKIGYTMTTVKSGPFKDLGNPDREMTTEEKALLQNTVDEVHQQFVRDVAKARNLPEEKIRAVADGRILTGASAQALGLVDELGNFEDALRAAAALGKIEGEPKLVPTRKKRFSLLNLVLGSDLGNELNSYAHSLGWIRYQAPIAP